MITAQQFWAAAILGPIIVGVFLSFFLGTTKRAITASEGRIIDRIDRAEKDIIEGKGEIKILHGRVTGVETSQARLEGEWDARKTDSKGNLKSYPK
jgi:hypothetical protein